MSLAYRDLGLVSLLLSRGPGLYGNVSIKYYTSDLTAKFGIDYTLSEGIVVFLDGWSQVTLNLNLVNDGQVKPARAFLVNLTNATGITLLHYYG